MLTSKHLEDVTGAIVTSQIFRFLIAVVELGLMFVVLTLILIASPFAALVTSLAFCFLGLFVFITGRRLPRLRGRIKGASVLATAGIYVLVAIAVQNSVQQETRWAELRNSDLDAYLAELAPINRERWLEELRELRPEEYAQAVETARLAEEAAAEAARLAEAEAEEQRETLARLQAVAERLVEGSDDIDTHRAMFARVAIEMLAKNSCTEREFIENGGWKRTPSTFDSSSIYYIYCGGTATADRLFLDAETGEVYRRTDEVKAQRQAQCTDTKVSSAYVMIQADVRRNLIAPSTAVFPGRYGSGTRHLGDCLYQVNGQFDSQNGFGAMLRSSFSGTTRFFPESGSWQTQSLTIN